MRLARLIAFALVCLAPASAWAMPQVAIAVAAAYAGAAVATAVLTTAAIGTFSYIALSTAVGFAVSYAGSALLGNSSGPQQDTGGAGAGSGSFQAEARGRTQVVRSAVATRKRVYGQVMLSGPLVYAEVGGTDNQYLHMVIPLAPHSVYEIGDVYFGDELVGVLNGAGDVINGRFAGYARIKKHLGSTTQVADADLIAESGGIWTAAHRLQGVAYVYVRLQWSQDVFPSGIPNVKALVKGNDAIYDPRSLTSGYSNNWALCVRDYLKAAGVDGGLECATDEVDETYISAAANTCDELVTLADASTQARYTCDGTVDTAKRPVDILKDLMSGAAGTITYPAGAFRLFPGAYTTPTVTLSHDDLRGPVQVSARIPRRELFNAVRGTYSSPDNFWQPSDFPVVTNATYAADDGNEVIYRDIELPYTTHAERAQRLAKIHLEKSRQGITVQMPCKMTVFDLAMWDTAMVTNSAMGWSSKVFRVVSWKLGQDGIGVDLTLREDTAASYDWAAGEATIVDAAPDTNLPSAFTVAAPGTPLVTEDLYETTGSAGVKARAIVSWAASADAFVVGYEAQYKPAADTDWLSLAPISLLSAQKDDLGPGRYEFRVRAANGVGVRSAWSATTTKELLGLTAAPADVSGFTIIKSAGVGIAQWTQHADLDVRIGGRIVIRWSPAVSGATWGNSVIYEFFTGDQVHGLVPLRTGTYMAKAQDSTGHYSDTAVSFVATEGMVTGFTTVGTLTENAAYTGAKTNVALVGAGIQIDTTTLFDSGSGSFDSAGGYFDSYGGISATGSYAFSTYLDLTTVATRRFDSSIAVAAFDTGDLFDIRLGDFDDGTGLFDGTLVDDTDATLYIATTDDNPAGSPTWAAWAPFFVGDFTCRAAKFKLDMQTATSTHNLSVTALTVSAKVPV